MFRLEGGLPTQCPKPQWLILRPEMLKPFLNLNRGGRTAAATTGAKPCPRWAILQLFSSKSVTSAPTLSRLLRASNGQTSQTRGLSLMIWFLRSTFVQHDSVRIPLHPTAAPEESGCNCYTVPSNFDRRHPTPPGVKLRQRPSAEHALACPSSDVFCWLLIFHAVLGEGYKTLKH